MGGPGLGFRAPFFKGDIDIGINKDVDVDMDMDMAVSVIWGPRLGFSAPLKGVWSLYKAGLELI